jgi:SPP1 family predicted phage head-tail adaptor
MKLNASLLCSRVTILTRVDAQESVYGTDTVTWTALATVWADVQDVLPSRAERLADSIIIANRPCRVRMRWRSDITSTMRLQLDGRTLQIIAGPAKLGRREGLELVAEDLTTGGQEP